MSRLAHPAAAGGTYAAAAAHEACTDTYASFAGAEPSGADSDSDEAALPPQTPLNGVPQLSSGGSGSTVFVGGCGAGSCSKLGEHTTACGNDSNGSATGRSALRIYEYHVLHSAAYGVPLLFLRGSHAGGSSTELVASAAAPDTTSACARLCTRALQCKAATGPVLSCRRAAAAAGGDSGGPAAAVPGGGAAAGRRRGRRLSDAAGQLRSVPSPQYLLWSLLYSSTPSPHELNHVTRSTCHPVRFPTAAPERCPPHRLWTA